MHSERFSSIYEFMFINAFCQSESGMSGVLFIHMNIYFNFIEFYRIFQKAFKKHVN